MSMTGPESPPRKRGRLIGEENDEKAENMVCLLLTGYNTISARCIEYGNAILYLDGQRSCSKNDERKASPHPGIEIGASGSRHIRFKTSLFSNAELKAKIHVNIIPMDGDSCCRAFNLA